MFGQPLGNQELHGWSRRFQGSIAAALDAVGGEEKPRFSVEGMESSGDTVGGDCVSAEASDYHDGFGRGLVELSTCSCKDDEIVSSQAVHEFDQIGTCGIN